MKTFGLTWVLSWWVLFVLVPLVQVAVSAFSKTGLPSTLDRNLFFDPLVLKVVATTALQAGLSTLLSLTIGVPFGLWLGRYFLKKSGTLISALLSVPNGVSSLVAALAWVYLLGRNGFLPWAYTLKAVVLAHVFLNIPLVTLWVAHARLQVPLAEIDGARCLGAGWIEVFKSVIWPRIRWSVASAGVQVFSFCLMSFALVLILGGGPPVESLETLLYSHIRYRSLDIHSAGIYAFWEVLLTMIPWLLLVGLRQRQTDQEMKMNWAYQDSLRGYPPFKWEGFLLAAGASFFLFPYFILVWKSASSILELFDASKSAEWSSALQVSVILAGISALLSVFTAVCAILGLKHSALGKRFRNILEVGLSLPAGISVLVLSLGTWLVYGDWVDPFEGSLLAMSTVQATLFFPFAFRILWPLGQGRRSRALEASFCLGASAWQGFWLVEWPRWRGPILSAFAAVAAGSLAEFGAASFFYSENLMPIPLLISRWMTKYRFDEAQGLASLLLLVSCSLVLFSFYFGRGRRSR